MSPILIVEWGKNRPTRVYLNNRIIGLWDGNRSVSEAKNREIKLLDDINKLDEILIINYKEFINYFGSCDTEKIFDFPLSYDNLKDAIRQISSRKDELFKEWQEIRADAAEAYQKIEDRGVLYDYKVIKPKYSMNVFSGRSKTTGFNIQGTNREYQIRHVNPTYNIFICFDWIAADARIGSILSGDETLNKSFEKSDPYTFIEDFVDGEVERDNCKLAFNQAVNALNLDDEVLEIFPTYKKWIKKQIINIRKNGYSESILGRRFYADDNVKGYRRSFNGILQGSVAHAMQNVIAKIERTMGDIVLTEQHDSLTVCTSQVRMAEDIKRISSMMLHPFRGYLKGDYVMPLKVSFGKKWCDYKFLKEYR